IETFIRKQLRLKAHTVTHVEETAECMVVQIDRLGKRLLRCGVCRQPCLEVHDIRREREWRDLSMRKLVRSKYARHPAGVVVYDERSAMRDRFHWARLLAFVTGLVNQALLLRNEYLAAENRILRSHLPSRLRLSDAERSTLAEIAKRLGRKALR